MQQILNITSEPKQQYQLLIENQGTITLQLEYVDSQLGWFFNVITSDDSSYCRRITNCPNLLRDKQNTLKFSLACTVENGLEPFSIDDFKSGNAKLYILSHDEVQYIGKEIYGKIF
jgi:hypothetical protein